MDTFAGTPFHLGSIMKGVSSTTGLEIQMEPFVIDLTSPCSTAPSTPTSEISESDVWSDTTAPSSPPSSLITKFRDLDTFSNPDTEDSRVSGLSPVCAHLSLFETLVEDSSPAARAAILYYLPLSPVVQRDISTLVPLLLHDFEIMASLATNIAYYYAHSFISEAELECLLTQILLCGDSKRKMNLNFDNKIQQLYHFTKRQIERYRAIIVTDQQLRNEQNHEKMLQKNAAAWEKKGRRKRRTAREALPDTWHARTEAPLPYVFGTLADVFVHVNEMYTLTQPPGADWAQARISTYHGMGLGSFPPRVVLPEQSADKRAPGMAGLVVIAPLCEGGGFSQT